MFGMNKLFGADEIKVTGAQDEAREAQNVLYPNNPKREVDANPLLAAPYGSVTPSNMYAEGAKLASGDTKPTRPGDTPPRAFVGKTLDQLKKTQESYVAERDLLAKDIQKLTEEHWQVIRSLTAINAAIASLEAPETQVDMQKLEDELTNVGTV